MGSAVTLELVELQAHRVPAEQAAHQDSVATVGYLELPELLVHLESVVHRVRQASVDTAEQAVHLDLPEPVV